MAWYCGPICARWARCRIRWCPAIVELDANVSWAVTSKLELSLAGYNLLQPEHEEFVEPGVSTEIPRMVLAQMRVHF
jgi:hypothetical protein